MRANCASLSRAACLSSGDQTRVRSRRLVDEVSDTESGFPRFCEDDGLALRGNAQLNERALFHFPGHA